MLILKDYKKNRFWGYRKFYNVNGVWACGTSFLIMTMNLKAHSIIPYLYENICKIFPVNVKAIYIRQTGKNKKEKVTASLNNTAQLDVATCYFKKSSEAIAHSKKIGLIS